MKKTNRIATIQNGNSFIERQIYADEENNEYIKIYNTFISLSVVKEYYKYGVNIWF